MRVLANDLYPDEKFAKEEGITYVSLDELYKESDIISLHCPLTDQTRYLINDDSIAKMKDGVMIINTGRGLLIHTNALIEGLRPRKYPPLDWMSTRRKETISTRINRIRLSMMMSWPVYSRSTM